MSFLDVLKEEYLAEFTSQYVEIMVRFWINTFEPSIDLYQVRSGAMINCQRALRDEGFTFSSDTTASVGLQPVEVHVENQPPRQNL